MKLKAYAIFAAACLGGAAAHAQLAITETMSSASTNLGPSLVVQGPDFWELTNFGTNSVDLSGYIFNDSDAIRGGDADSSTLSGVTIGPGESIILVQTGTTVVRTRDDFINWWGAANLPANVQVLFYSGNGQSSSGDSIVLWAPTATSDADYVDRADFGEALRGHSFTYNASTGAYGIISSNGVGGAFKAVTSDDEGSPGHTTGAVTLQIIQQPTPSALTAPASSDAAFSAAAQGLPHAHYQWVFNRTNLLAGATFPTLTITNAQLTDSGSYTVIVTNGLQSRTSSVAVLTVTTAPSSPTWLKTPADADAFFGQQVQFTAQASGSPTPSLKWQKNAVDMPGQTSGTLILNNVQTEDAATYTVIAANNVGTNTATVILTVGPKPRLLITETHPSGSGESAGHQDWWELTSFDTRTFNLKGWRWDDNSHSVAPGNAYVFTNDIYIHPGETAVFVENMTPAAFRVWWGNQLPPGLQIVTYGGGGLGLSQTADEVNLWNAVTLVGNELPERICGINFAQSFVGFTLVYDPENPPVAGVFGVYATNTVSGAAADGIFTAAVGGSYGSPGYIMGPIQLSSTLTAGPNLTLTWNSVANRNYNVQFKTNLTDTSWNLLTNLTATAASTTITDPLGSGQRFYRVGAVFPLISEP